MGRRRNPGCTCNACCPRCSLDYNEPYCSIDWDCSSCCGTDYEDNQRYLLVALNDDNSTYADYGEVGKSGRIVGVRGKRYRLTVEGPDCYLNRVYYRSVPSGPCRSCPDDCTPNVPYTTHEISGLTDTLGSWVLVTGSGSNYKYRETTVYSAINHTKNYAVSVGLRPSLCPYAYMLGEKYLIASASTQVEAIEDPGAPWEGPLKTASSAWDVYGFFDFTSPSESPIFRLSFILQSWSEFSVFSTFGPRYLRAPLMPTRAALLSPPVGASGYRIDTRHAPSNPPLFAAAPWCDTNPKTIFFAGGIVTSGSVRWIGGVL